MKFKRTASGMAVWVVAALCAGLVGASGCSRKTVPPPVAVPATPMVLPQTMPSEEEARQVEEGAEEAIPPAWAEGGAGARGELFPPVTEAPAGSGPQRYGFRVQLYAASNPELAKERAEEFRALFDEPVYVEFEGLLYKVQVGDFLTRDEAAAMRRRALGAGCEGAFVVDALVKER
ncbi:MAG: SPOR domain-containing protein [Candidatus Eisenbacteria bacterium]